MPHPPMPTTTMSPRTLTGDGPDLAFLAADATGGMPLVLLHGLSAHSSSWAPVTARFQEDWRVFALDFRGHGRSGHDTGGYRFADYCSDAERLLHAIGEPAVVVGHSLGALVAAELAQRDHPLVAAVFLEDPPLYVVEPAAFAKTGLARAFPVLREHTQRLQSEGAPVESFRDLIAAAPHPAGDTQGDHLLPDALWSRAESLSRMDVDAFTAMLDGRTFAGYDPDRCIGRPGVVVRADPACDPSFRPEDEARLHATSPHLPVIEMPGAAHNIRGDRAARGHYLDTLGQFLERARSGF
jgi:pimeloyl-ACP methyl ester carboxylesterase